MKEKTKLTKLWTILLSLVMLLSLLPTTALAATYNDVKVNGVSLGDGKYLANNTATTANSSSTKPSSYVAWYKDGTLTLNGYEGTGIVLQGAPAADLIIKLIGDNTITTTTHETGIQGNSAAGSITITADSGSNGNLTIDMTNSTRPVFGINGYANSVTITGSADVKITAVATATNQETYGIKSSKAVSILDSASVSITCKTPNSTSRSDSCNGIYSDTGVTINTGGTIQIDVHKAGDEAYSYGINSMGTLTLTKVGGMTVKWKKAGVQGAPLLPSSASFDPTAYDTHMDTMDTTNCTATYMPKGTTPAGNYSDSVRVYNANKKLIGLGNGECLTANDATGASSYTGGSSYVARYDKSSGTLYLKDYHGVAADGQIYAHGDLNIVVENDSSFTTSVSATNNLYGIQAGGKLNISGSGKLTVTANGNGDVYGIYADKGVTISAPLNVQVGKVDSSKNGPVYGIYTRSGAISLSGADKTITATGGTSAVYGVYNAANTSTAITNNGNIDIRGKLTVNLYNGGSNDGIRTDGGGTITLDGATVNIPSNFGTGIYNFKGNVVIENGSNVTLSSDTSYGIGIYARYGGDLTIENSTVTVSAKRLTASVEKGTLSIKDSIVDLTLEDTFYRVVATDNSATNTIDLSGSGSVTLTASGNQTSAMIGGKVTATSGTKLEKGTYYPGLETYDGEYDGSSKTVLQFVHEAPASATYTVSFDANGGTGTMADVTDISGEYTLPANGFTAPDGKQFKAWSVGGVEKAAGDTITVNANTTVTAIWKDAPVIGTENTTVDYENFIIYTEVENSSNIADILVLSNSAVAVTTASYTYGSVEFYGTGTLITVTDGGKKVGDFTLIVIGDVNGDSVCDVIDAAQVASASSAFNTLSGAYQLAADFNSDGLIDATDYQAVVNKSIA